MGPSQVVDNACRGSAPAPIGWARRPSGGRTRELAWTERPTPPPARAPRAGPPGTSRSARLGATLRHRFAPAPRIGHRAARSSGRVAARRPAEPSRPSPAPPEPGGQVRSASAATVAPPEGSPERLQRTPGRRRRPRERLRVRRTTSRRRPRGCPGRSRGASFAPVAHGPGEGGGRPPERGGTWIGGWGRTARSRGARATHRSSVSRRRCHRPGGPDPKEGSPATVVGRRPGDGPPDEVSPSPRRSRGRRRRPRHEKPGRRLATRLRDGHGPPASQPSPTGPARAEGDQSPGPSARHTLRA